MKIFKGIVSTVTFLFILQVALAAFGLTSADGLMSFGISPEAANYISSKLITVNSSGNLVLPVASSKKLSVTVAGTEELSVNGSAVTAATNDIVATAGNITATAGNIAATAGSVAAGTTVTGGTGVTATTGNVTATAGALSGLRLVTNSSTGYESVAGAGSTTSDAAALSVTKGFHTITGANGTLGWKFASLAAGDVHVLLSTTAGVPKVYAPTGGTCNGGSADAACSLTTGILPHICVATSTTAMICA